jgi:hypothetical protein
MKRSLIVAFTIAAVAAATLAVLPGLRSAPRTAPRELWFYEAVSLADPAAVAKIPALWRRATAAGYAKVVLVDWRFARPRDQDAAWLGRVRMLRALADSLGLEIVPGVSLVGRGNGAMLAADPNLAEALPVRDALLEVRGGVARVIADPPVALGPRPQRVDAGVVLDGAAARARAGGPRLAWTLGVAPWRSYHVAFSLAGEGFRGEPRVTVTGDGRELAYAAVPSPAGTAPERRDVVFNSQGCRSVTIGFSTSRASRGALRWSDWRIEETGPVNLVRRPGLAFRIAGLTEGRDFDAVADPLLGASPERGRFDAWHEPPVVRVRRPDGTRLRASWHQAAVILRGQVACCLSDTAVIARQLAEIRRVRELFGARTVFLMHDEIRAIGLDSTCLATGRTPGQVLAANVRAIRAGAGGVRLCVWGDMFDPEQNAVDGYYLVRGSLAGSWEGLDPGIDVVNWNGGRIGSSLRFFARAGHRQVWAGYYDGPPGAIADVLPQLDQVTGTYAVLYATWRERYDDLEAFARAVRGRR